MTIYRDEYTKRVQHMNAVLYGLALVTGFQGFSMFFGLKDMIPNGVEGTVLPAIAAVVIGVVFWMIWHHLIPAAALSTSPHTRIRSVLIGIALTLATIGTTSWFLATTFGGDRAVRAHMNTFIGDATRQLSVLNSNAASEQGLVGLVGEIAAGWKGMAESEVRGNVSGQKGDGPKADMYRRASQSMLDLQSSINTTFASYSKARVLAAAQIDAMTSLANSPASATADGQARFASLASKLYQDYGSMERLTALPQVETVGIVKIDTSAEAATRSDAQTKRLYDAASQIKADRKALEPRIYVPTSKGAATLEYASSIPGSWVVAVVIDLIPFIVMLMMMNFMAEAMRPYERREPFSVVGGREAA